MFAQDLVLSMQESSTL